MNQQLKRPANGLIERTAQQTAETTAQAVAAALAPLLEEAAQRAATNDAPAVAAAFEPYIKELAWQIGDALTQSVPASLGPQLEKTGEQVTAKLIERFYFGLWFERLFGLVWEGDPNEQFGASGDALLERGCRLKYGDGFVSAVDDRDEMFKFLREVAHKQRPYISDAEVKTYYILQGEQLFTDLVDVLRDTGCELDRVQSVLDFACGYGRVSRYWVHKLGREKVTVSDIDRDAVDFVRRSLGVNGFYSVMEPDQLAHDGKYDVICVVSLFTHLPLATWTVWLKRLYAMLNPGGRIVFSTTGIDIYNAFTDEQKKPMATGVDGFYFWGGHNETEGRLPSASYGGTILSEGFVRGVVASEPVGKLLGFFPKKLGSYQDLYVIAK